MNNRMTALTGVLVLQLVLAAGLYWRNQTAATAPPASPLVAGPTAAITRILVEGKDGKAELAGGPGAWRLPNLDNLPASTATVDALLSKLGAVDTGWPVTTTASSHVRFEVAEDNFQRRVRVYDDEKLVADFLLGTSPGFRKVHLRREGEPEVYAVELSSFEFPSADADWLDKGLVSHPEATTIQTPDLDLERGEEGWVLRGQAGSESTTAAEDKEQVTGIADAITGLQVTGVAEAEAGAVPPDAYAVTVTGADGTSVQLSFYRSDASYLVYDSASEKTFEISQYDFERIVGATDDDAVPATDEESSTTPPEQNAMQHAESETEPDTEPAPIPEGETPK
jgi:hypothetical protein